MTLLALVRRPPGSSQNCGLQQNEYIYVLDLSMHYTHENSLLLLR